MPVKAAARRATRDKRQGKAPSTQAGEFVREEMHRLREGTARTGRARVSSPKQAVAIGLSEARRAGVKLKRSRPGQAARTGKAARTREAART